MDVIDAALNVTNTVNIDDSTTVLGVGADNPCAEKLYLNAVSTKANLETEILRIKLAQQSIEDNINKISNLKNTRQFNRPSLPLQDIKTKALLEVERMIKEKSKEYADFSKTEVLRAVSNHTYPMSGLDDFGQCLPVENAIPPLPIKL